MTLQHRAFSFELDTKATDVDQRVVAGYASAFGVVDSYRERVMRGAFAESIARSAKGERPIKVLYQHNWEQPIGRPTLMQEDGKGLYTISQLADTATVRDEIMPLLKDGVLDRMSIGFMVEQGNTTWNEDEQLLDLDVIDLWEYSLVTFPANDEAQVQSVKGRALGAMGCRSEKAASIGDLDAVGAQYAMAVLMGARGAGSFDDLPTGERAQFHADLSRRYAELGLEPPVFVPSPVYSDVEFRHDERAIYLGRYLGKRLADVTSGARGYAKTGRPLPPELRSQIHEALGELARIETPLVDFALLERRARAEAVLGL